MRTNSFSRDCCDRTRFNGFKLNQGRFRLDIRKRFFPMTVVRPWPRLPREAVAAPSLGTFKARLDGALSNLIQLKMSLLTAGVWARWPLKVPSNPKCSVILRCVVSASKRLVARWLVSSSCRSTDAPLTIGHHWPPITSQNTDRAWLHAAPGASALLAGPEQNQHEPT